MRKIREALRLHHEHGASQHEIGRSAGLAQSTAGEILRRAKAAGLAWPLAESLSDEDLDRMLYPPAKTSDEPPRPLPDWSGTDRELARKGVTLELLWFEYRAEHPDGYGYSRFADLYRAWKGRTDLRMLQRHKAGEKLFVDFAGLTMPITDPGTGEVRQAPVFVSAMGASQRIFAKAFEAQTSECWLAGLQGAFGFYGALPHVVVPDNPKACVTSPDRFEPVLNPAFADFARFFDIAVIPARVRKPRDKAKVENAVQQAERWVLAPLRHQTFFSLDELNRAIAAQVAELDVRVMKGRGVSRREFFEEVDRPEMRTLPTDRYRPADWTKAKLAPDYHVEFEGHRYSAPSELVGRRLELRVTLDTVEIFLGSKRIFTHVRSLRRWGFTTEPAHMPSHHRQYAEWTPERIERWALTVGPSAADFVVRLLRARVHPEQAFKSCMGVMSLAKTFGKDRVEAACARAIHFQAFSYRNVKTILDKGLDAEGVSQIPKPVADHANVRGADYYKEAGACAN
jgi:transposase